MVVGMSATTILVAAWTYLETGSFWKALAWALATLVILQAGYFVLVIRLIYRRAQSVEESRDPIKPAPPLHRDGIWF